MNYTRRFAWVFGLLLGFYPSSTDRLGSIWFPTFGLTYDFSTGHAVVPLEEIFPGLSYHPDADVTRHALRIMEQHYVQRERLEPARMLKSAIRSLAREHGGDIELGFLRLRPTANVLQLSSHKTIQLCPSMSRESAAICPDSGLISPETITNDLTDMEVVLRVGLRVFGVPILAEPGLKSLDLIGRFVVPEYAKLRGLPVSQVVHTYLNGLLDELDPHSAYMTPDEYRELRSGTRGQFGGVGLVIDESQELPVIREVVPNSPAHMAGIRPGDVLLKVDKHISAFRPLESVLRGIRELSVDSAAPVWFFRPTSRRVYRSYLAREEIPTRSVELRIVEGHPEILHIRVTGFSNHTSEDVYALYEHAQLVSRGKLKMVLLDLRGNPGGLLDQAIQVSDLFLRQGKIVSTRSRFEDQVEQATRGLKIDLPLVVLVNSSSASASEIVAGALKDHGRALVVGERTFGKGSVQSLFELSTGTALKLTVAHYFTPGGASLQGVGVKPHVEVKFVQPQDDHLWMSGSSEFDREEHLAAHLLNPSKPKGGTTPAHQVSLGLWVLSAGDGQVLEGLRPLNFAYPAGDNTQTMTRLNDDPMARVGVRMGQLLFAGRSGAQVLTERNLREAHRRVLVDEAATLRGSLDQLNSQQKSVWRTLPKSFFDSPADERSMSPQLADAKINSTQGQDSAKGNESKGALRQLMNLFGVGTSSALEGKSSWPALSPRVSLSAKSLIAWQDAARIVLSVAAGEGKGLAKSGPLMGLLGLRLDDVHDGPVVWLPASFMRSGDKQWVSSVRLPKAVRSYLSTLPATNENPKVLGELKWKLTDEPLSLGYLQIPPLAKRYGRLTGQLSERQGQQFLRVQFSRPADPVMVSDDSDGAVSTGMGSGADQSPLEVLIATLSDDRLSVVSEVVPLQRVGEGDYLGETELKLSPVRQSGLGFAGVVGGIVRNAVGDVLLTSPLLWVGDDGVYPFEDPKDVSPVFPLER